MRRWSYIVALGALSTQLIAAAVWALPFNDDMVDVQKRTGTIMRPKATNSVPVGSLEYSVKSREEAIKLTNPIKNNPESIQRGRALFAVNCAGCHGNLEVLPSGADYKGGKVAANFDPNIRIPDIRDPFYRDTRTDGDFYGTLNFGSLAGLMPPVGWKFSPTEHWDLINFVRSVQKK